MPIHRKNILPGFGLSLGFATTYLTLIVLIPLAALTIKSSQLTWEDFLATITDPVVVASYKLTFGATAIAALINAVFGLITAWVLVRYRFPGRRIFDAMVDFPFALPTAVAGLSFSHLYLPDGWIGGLGPNIVAGINWFFGLFGVSQLLSSTALNWLTFPYTNTNAGVVVVLIFVGLPFVIRTVQPVLQEWDSEPEQAAACLGAGRWVTFRRIIFPELLPAWLAGFALSFARCVGEYGSVIFIAANKPGESQIAPLQIITKLDEFHYARATAIGLVLLLASLAILLVINTLEWYTRRAAMRT